MAGDPEREKLDQIGARIREAGKPEPDAELLSDADAFKGSTIGLSIVATVVGCVALGWLADRLLGTSPWGILTMVFVGFAGGMYNAWAMTNGPKSKGK